ncbi:MAG TPA: winged helix-turn-helix domain-containing protein [Candidatus Limnocylindria bacterium]|nr:winged helix-turn-helix domain-containing protein [Candidatus Limnocylindria bacterium]
MAALQEPPFVLVADDDPSYLARVRGALRLAGAHVAACRSVKVALEALEFHMPNVVVVAPEMEGGRGWDIVYAARAQGQLPTVALDRDETGVTRRTAFTAGVDDVLAIPADDTELATRVVALAGRGRRSDAGTPVYRHRGLVMDVAAHTVRVHARAVALTAQQFAILRALFEANGATLSRDRLLARIESLDEEPPSDRAIDLHVTRLRRRLGDDARKPRWVEAVYGVGYRLATGETASSEFAGDAEHVLAALPDPLLVIDTERRVRFANDAATRFLALPLADILGQRCGDILRCRDCHGQLLEGSRCFARAVASGDAALRDVPADIAVGDERVPVKLTYARVHSDGLMTLEIRPRDEDAALS